MRNKFGNEVVAILSYANDKKKLDVLNECVDVAKSHGFKLILSSAIDVPKEISDKVDFLIIDKENPVISGDDLASIGGAIFYNMNYGWFTNSYCIDMNHSYAVLKLVKNAAMIADINGFEITHYINYDYIINDSNLFNTHSNFLKENDLVYYYFNQNTSFMNTGFFSSKTDKVLQCFKEINSKENYCSKNIPVLEEFMLSTYKESGCKIYGECIENIQQNNKLDLISTSDYFVTKKIENVPYNFFLFLAKDANDIYYLITLSNLETEISLKFQDKIITLEVNNYPKIFRIEETLLDSGILIEAPLYNHTEIVDRNKKTSFCNIVDSSQVEYLENQKDLSEGDFWKLCIKNGTDKVHYHGYNYFYPNYIEKFRNENFNFLEIGYGDGKSLPVWIEYFPKANITIADIDFEFKYSDRCQVVKCDQSNLNDLENLRKSIGSAKLIIDDGSHNPLHQMQTFEYLFENLLEDGGVYIIEDIELSYWHPQSTLYGYSTGKFNLVSYFKKYQEMINSEFTGVKNELDISTITFAQNSIIITKRTLKEKKYFDRGYRFQSCVDGICNFG